MSDRSRELAAELVEIQSKYLSPSYEAVRRELMGELSDGAMAVDEVRQTAREQTSNLGFLSTVSNVFPHVDRYDYISIPPSNQFKVRVIQATTAWYVSGRPYMFIGGRQSPHDENTYEHLLLSAGGSPGYSSQIRVANTSMDTARALTNYSSKMLTTPLSADDAVKIFNSAIDMFTVSSESPGSLLFEDIPKLKKGFISWLLSETIPDPTEQIAGGKLPIAFSPDYYTSNGITDFEMAQFGVYERLGWLATVHDLTDEYMDALNARKS